MASASPSTASAPAGCCWERRRIVALRSCPIYDDAFITFRYARNLAEGLGLVYNPGAEWEPVLGTTTPLFALLLAGVAKLGFDLTIAAIALNMLFDAITAWHAAAEGAWTQRLRAQCDPSGPPATTVHGVVLREFHADQLGVQV